MCTWGVALFLNLFYRQAYYIANHKDYDYSC